MENKLVWEPYREFLTRQAWLAERTKMALLIHPLYTPQDVAKEIKEEFDERWKVIEEQLKADFKELEDQGLMEKEDGK